MRLRSKSQILVANASNQGERVVELISRRNMLAAATAAGGLLTAASVAAEQPRDFDPVNFTVVPPRRFEDLRVGDVFRAPSRKLAGRRVQTQNAAVGVALGDRASGVGWNQRLAPDRQG